MIKDCPRLENKKHIKKDKSSGRNAANGAFRQLWSKVSGWFVRTFTAFGHWSSRLWASVSKAWEPRGSKLRKYISPAFVVMLVISFFMWYIIKLGYTYTTELPVYLNIDGRQVRVTAVAEATGFRLAAQRYSGRKGISVRWSELEVTPSATNSRAVVISPYSLQNIISLRNPDIKIISMGNIPEVEL